MDPQGYNPQEHSSAKRQSADNESGSLIESFNSVPIRLTPITGRVSRTRKNIPVHVCDICNPPKTFTRSEHLRRHQLSHQTPRYPCTYPGCTRAFHRPDLLARHEQRHEQEEHGIDWPSEGNGPSPGSGGYSLYPSRIAGCGSRRDSLSPIGLDGEPSSSSAKTFTSQKPHVPVSIATENQPTITGPLETKDDQPPELIHTTDSSPWTSASESNYSIEISRPRNYWQPHRSHSSLDWQLNVGTPSPFSAERLIHAVGNPDAVNASYYVTPPLHKAPLPYLLNNPPLDPSLTGFTDDQTQTFQPSLSSLPSLLDTSAPSDSGYGSISHSRLESSIVQALTHTNPTGNSARPRLITSDGASTTYSGAQSLQNDGLVRYVAEFAEELSGMFPTSLPSTELSRLSSTLPPLLKAFAVKLGFCDTSPIAQNLMYLVHRYRHQITEALLKFFEFEENVENTFVPSASDVMPLEGLMSLWERKEHERDPIPQVTTPADRDGEIIDDYISNDEDEFPELREYREVLINSPAYSWLASTLASELQHETIGEDHRAKISQAIVNMLDARKYTISRKLAPPSVEVRFHTSWKLMRFLSYQDYEICPREAFPRALVLTGLGNNVQALTVAEYITQVWPYYGPEILKLYQDMVTERTGGPCRCVMADDTRIETLPSKEWNAEDGVFGGVIFTVTGAVYSVAEIGQIIAWLHAALSLSDLPTGIRVSNPGLEPITNGGRPIRPGTDIVAECKTYSTLGTERSDTVGPRSTTSGNCWSNILGNTVYVRGYPTARRVEHHTGMEVSFAVMIALANSRRLSRFKGLFCIKGFCSIILPTRLQEGLIYWHLVTNLDREYMSYTDHKIRRLWASYPLGLSTEILETSRHILGWCDNIQNLAGSEVATYDIGWSGLGHPRAGCAFDKVSITGGQFVTTGVTAIIGKRDKAVHIHSRDDYVMRLKWISKKFAVLYDLRDRRAWLLNGASALLHLVRASLRHDKNDPFKDLFLFDESSVEEPSDPFVGKYAAIRFLTNEVNTSLPIYAKPNESKEEQTTTDAGARTKIFSSTRRNYSLKDRIEDIYEILEQIMSHQADVFSQDGVGFRIKYTLRRQLEGFDFMDVATDEDPLWPRVTTINARGRGWMDFTRALHAITLFGTGFGELLRPTQALDNCFVCLTNVGVPKGEDYLAVCTSDLQELIEKRGSRNTSPWRLVDEIYWHTPDKAFEQCQCTKSSSRKHDRIQVILPASIPGFWGRGFKSPRNLPAQGAVLFGHSWRFPLRWKDHGPPEEGESQEDLEEVEASFHDSGLGSSIGSSARTGGGSSQSVSDTELDRQRVRTHSIEELQQPLKRPLQAQPDITDAVPIAAESMPCRPTKRFKLLGRHDESTDVSQPGGHLGYQQSDAMLTSWPQTRGSASISGTRSPSESLVPDPPQDQNSSSALMGLWRNNMRPWKGKGREQ